jgi:Zn-dependent protease
MPTLSRGTLTLGHIAGAPIRIHWTAPVGALLFGQLQFVPGFWIAFLGLILLHELGHAAVVRAVGGRVRGVLVTGLGGECAYDGVTHPLRRALVAWGGVAAQLVVLMVTGLLLLVFGPPTSFFMADLASGLTTYNLVLVGLNLIPFPPLDGAEAWKLFPLLGQWWAARKRGGPRVTPTSYPRRRTEPQVYDVEIEMKKLRDFLDGSPKRR